MATHLDDTPRLIGSASALTETKRARWLGRHRGKLPFLAVVFVSMAVGGWRSLPSKVRAIDPMAVSSSGRQFVSLPELVNASTAVVIGEVTDVRSGRIFSAGNGSGLRSQLVTLRVGKLLSGSAPAQVTMEEEATTADGVPLVVDGLRPSEVGDVGIFFVVSAGDGDESYWATVSTAGRYLRDSTAPNGDRLLGATGSGELAVRLMAAGGRSLTAAVLAVSPNSATVQR
jgi:hypothetical protein